MDPLSITTGCLTLIATVGKTSITVVNFIKTCREARADLTSVNRELSELSLVLEILRDDTVENDDAIPSNVRKQILSIISSCSDILSRIASVLTKHDGRTAPVRWAIDGSDSIQTLRQLLEGHRGALSLAVDTVALALTREIKKDTSMIHADTVEIKQDTAKILDEISRLKALLPQDRLRNRASFILHRYLDDVNRYAETVNDEIESIQCEVGTIREAEQYSIETIHEATGIPNPYHADTTHEMKVLPSFSPRGVKPWARQHESFLKNDDDHNRNTISTLSTDWDTSSPTVSLLPAVVPRKPIQRAQYLNGSSGRSEEPAGAVASEQRVKTRDLSSGQARETQGELEMTIGRENVVALMQHLMTRDAQRSARDTEIITLLMNSALDPRLSKLRGETYNTLVEDVSQVPEQSAAADIERASARLEDQSFRYPNAKPSETAQRGSLWRRAFTRLRSTKTSDLARIEVILMELLGEADALRADTAPSRSVDQQPEAPTDGRGLGYMEELGVSYDELGGSYYG